MYDFSVDYRAFDTSNIIDIQECLMKKTWYKIIFGLIKKMFMGLLICIVNASDRTKRVSLSDQKRKIQPTLINLHPNEYNQELLYYPFAVKLDRSAGSCTSLNDLLLTIEYVKN